LNLYILEIAIREVLTVRRFDVPEVAAVELERGSWRLEDRERELEVARWLGGSVEVARPWSSRWLGGSEARRRWRGRGARERELELGRSGGRSRRPELKAYEN
jgi:hypothetical protein